MCQAGGVKTQNLTRFEAHEAELVATFGGARLVKNLDGRHELVGGTASDHAAAGEWISLFAHGIVFTGEAAERQQ